MGLMQEAQVGHERAQRERLAGQWKAQARSALADEQYEVARAAAEQWLQLSPEDPEALDVLSQGEVVEETIDAVPSSNLEAGTNVVSEEATQLRTETNTESKTANRPVLRTTSFVKAEKLVILWALSTVVGLTVGGLSVGEGFLLYGAWVILVIGVLEWLVLRSYIKKAGWWILANMMGWALGWASFSVLNANYIVSLVVTGATGGLITGLAFVWLLKNRR